MKLHTFLTAFLLTVLSAGAVAQPDFSAGRQPVKASASIMKEGTDSLLLAFDLSIRDRWHVYSTNQKGGPTSATVRIDSISGAALAGSLFFEGTEISVFDPVFETTVSYFEKSVRFMQKAAITAPDWHIEGNLTYGACNDESCLPPTRVEFLYTQSSILEADAKPLAQNADATAAVTDLSPLPGFDAATWAPVTYETGTAGTASRGLFGLFLTSMLGGLLALLTPCVWPIIPMTVSFFLKRSTDRRQAMRDAILYGLCIMAVYVGIGLAVTLIFGANALNELATNAAVNLIFFAVLVLFALSFFGLFEITLPGSWSTGADRRAGQSGKAGFAGLFFMALTLAIVSFSCTGPIIGFLLVDAAQNGSILAPMVGMTGFSLALAVPFALFAMFPHWLESMPKSGSWMDKVKVTLGFVELAFALKFLSVADMAYGWGILPRELFILLWFLMALVLGLYLCGFFSIFKDRQKSSGRKKARAGALSIGTGILSLAFAAWLVTGFFGAPLKAISAFCPPMSTSIFKHAANANGKIEVAARFTDYAKALEESARTGLPVLLDFTGYGCVNCRKMEAAVWTDPMVAQTIMNDFILVSLYVDDRTPLPATVTVMENGQKVKLRSTGDVWSLLQRYKFQANAQPFYVIVDSRGRLLSAPYTFYQDPDRFREWMSTAHRSGL